MTRALDVLCAGAVQGLVEALQDRFASAEDAALRVRFGAVGFLQDAVERGAPCDVLIVTDAMLRSDGLLDRLAGPPRPIGIVRTGVAVRAGEPVPPIGDAEALRAAFAAAAALFVPDVERSTAGRHVVAVLDRIGLTDGARPRLAAFDNGALAMRALAESGELRAIGCTQISEIVRTAGLTLVGPLPEPFGLATAYAAAVLVPDDGDRGLAERFVESLCSDAMEATRRRCGIEPLAGQALK